jgi:hypothetical protein
MRTLVTLSTIAVLVTVGVGTLAAQREVKHRGFWIGFGLGGGWNTTENVSTETLAGGAGYIRLGGTPSERFLVGGEVNVWVREDGNVTQSQGNATLTVLFYPSRSGGFFLKGGFGGATVQYEQSTGSVTTTVTDQGYGTTFGLGYDVRLGRNFYVTPNADLLFQRIEDVEYTLFLVSVGVTWH